MGRYKVKPVEIEAYQITRMRRIDNSNWPEWLNKAWNKNREAEGSVYPANQVSDGMDKLVLWTRRGKKTVQWDDYIILNNYGELDVCDAKRFEADHEYVPADRPPPRPIVDRGRRG